MRAPGGHSCQGGGHFHGKDCRQALRVAGLRIDLPRIGLPVDPFPLCRMLPSMTVSLLRACLILVVSAVLSACAAPPVREAARPTGPVVAAPVVHTETLPGKLGADAAAQNFITVARIMKPQIEEECRQRTRGQRNCNYRILVDDRATEQPNAFQTEDKNGNPVIAFNLALIAEARNPDELAFVMGHEAAHHILGHLQSKSQDAATGAMILGVLAAATGADAATISQAQDFGANVGSRAYSKDYELAADRLGTVITWDAGFNPVRGAEFFARIPDPGDSFLGSHPANSARIAVVRQTVAQLQAGAI